MITRTTSPPAVTPHAGRAPGPLRDQVIALAMAAAREGAIEGLSMRDLSRRLGVSPGAIYRHFADREAILKAVAEAGFVLMADMFEDAVASGSAAKDGADALARFERLAEAYVGFARAHYGLWRLMFGPYGCDTQFRDPSKAPTYQWLGKVLAELRAFGAIESATPEDQDFVWTAIHGFSDLQALPGAPVDGNGARVRGLARRILRSLGGSEGQAPGV